MMARDLLAIIRTISSVTRPDHVLRYPEHRHFLSSLRHGLLGCVLAACLPLVACSRQEEPAPPPRPAAEPAGDTQPVSMDALLRGARLYQEHCAQCHGPEAQGHPDWQNPQVVAAPPLDGSGNVWKRSKKELVAIIQNGAARGGQPVMPGWKGRLSDKEIEDIIAWFQALWPAEVYERWRKAQVSPSPPAAGDKHHTHALYGRATQP